MNNKKGTFFRNKKGKIRLIWWLLLLAVLFKLAQLGFRAYQDYNDRKEQENKLDAAQNIISSISEGVQGVAENT